MIKYKQKLEAENDKYIKISLQLEYDAYMMEITILKKQQKFIYELQKFEESVSIIQKEKEELSLL